MWWLILVIVIAILISGFASLNSVPVSVNLLFWQAPAVPLALVVLFSILVGVILAGLFGAPQYFKNMQKVRELENKIKELEGKLPEIKEPEQINTLKNLAEIGKGEDNNEETQEQNPPEN